MAGTLTPKKSLLLLTSSRSETQTINGSHKFVIQGYSIAKGMGVGKHIVSGSFTVGGYCWAIYFYPDGRNPKENSAYVSVFIVLASNSTDVRALFELILVDQSGKGKHKVRSHFGRPLENVPHTLKCKGSMWGYKRFFRRSLLESSDFLKNDCLKINCTVGVVVSTIDSPQLHSINVPESDIGSHFGALLENMEGSDVIFNVAGERFPAHKLVLTARSPEFRSKFFDGLNVDNQEIIVTDLDTKVFKAMLHFIYRDTLMEEVDEVSSTTSSDFPILETLTAKLLAAADKYGLERLKLMCESRLCKDICVNSVANILTLADNCHATELKAVCLKFAAQNLAESDWSDQLNHKNTENWSPNQPSLPIKTGFSKAAVMRSEGFESMKEKCPRLQSEILKTIVGCEVDSCSAGEKSQSVWAQLSDGGDVNSRRVRQRI
ncbi:hypothetical protein Lal_00048816 [Lupinus albus]|nr:hypothetical protein Lal_00048816 [Lupinus albus]